MVNYGGIYKIENTLTGDCYVGSAVNFVKRARIHKHMLLRGKHDCVHLQRALTKYGPAAFRFKALLVCRRQDLIFFEQRAIDILNPRYNIARVAGNMLGTTKSPEARAKMRAKKLGTKHSSEHKAKISAALKGRKPYAITDATRLKMRASRLRFMETQRGR